MPLNESGDKCTVQTYRDICNAYRAYTDAFLQTMTNLHFILNDTLLD